jgi:hypothetical protein
VRLVEGARARGVFTSSAMRTSEFATPFTPGPTQFNLPAGVLSYGNDYLIGIRLQHNELEAFLPNNALFSPLENRSTAFLEVSLVPEPQAYAMLLAGLGLLGFSAGRRIPGKPSRAEKP